MMKKEDFKLYENKKIKLFLKGERYYTGYIKELKEEYFILQDKYNELIMIKYEAIEYVESIRQEDDGRRIL